MRRVKRSKRKKAWTYILICLMIVSLYILIFRTHYYNQEPYLFTGVLLGISSLVALQAMWFEVLPRSKWNRAANGAILLFIMTPIGGLVYFLHNSFIDYHLKHYPVTTTAKVVELYKVRMRSGYAHYAKIEYDCNYERYTQKLHNTDFTYSDGDRLRIICSKKEPEIFEVLGFKK